MRFWEFIDGYYLTRNTDLVALFNELDAARSMNIIENIIVEDGIRGLNVMAEEQNDVNMLENARTDIIKVYNSSSTSVTVVDNVPSFDTMVSDPLRPFNPNIPKYIEPTDTGYPGLEPPIG